MKYAKQMEMLLIHLCCVCSLLLLAVRVLNWYNPYMGILDRNIWIADCLCLGSIFSAVLSSLLDLWTKRGQQPTDTSIGENALPEGIVEKEKRGT